MKLKAAAAALAATSLLFTTGCGSSDDDKAAKSISSSLMKAASSPTSSLDLSRKQADCVGQGFVDKVGTENLQKYGILDKNMQATTGSLNHLKMSQKDATNAADTLVGCTNMSAMMTKNLEKSGQVPTQAKKCLEGKVTEDVVKGMFTKIFMGDQQAAMTTMIKAVSSCAPQQGG